MSLQPKISEIKSDFSVLKQQGVSTSENWNDSVQNKFYEQFIDSLPKEFNNYIKSLNHLDKKFESSERLIDELE